MPLSDTIKTLIRNAWDDGYPCLVATNGREGPNITPKGSMIVFDDGHLAWWERSKRVALENLTLDPRVCIMYANFQAQHDKVLESSFLRFFGSVVLAPCFACAIEQSAAHEAIVKVARRRRRKLTVIRRGRLERAIAETRQRQAQHRHLTDQRVFRAAHPVALRVGA